MRPRAALRAAAAADRWAARLERPGGLPGRGGPEHRTAGPVGRAGHDTESFQATAAGAVAGGVDLLAQRLPGPLPVHDHAARRPRRRAAPAQQGPVRRPAELPHVCDPLGVAGLDTPAARLRPRFPAGWPGPGTACRRPRPTRDPAAGPEKAPPAWAAEADDDPTEYTPQFSHKDWIDFVDSVQASGTNGINIRFHGIEAEFATISSVIAQIAQVLATPPVTSHTLTLAPPLPQGGRDRAAMAAADRLRRHHPVPAPARPRPCPDGGGLHARQPAQRRDDPGPAGHRPERRAVSLPLRL